MSDYNETLHHGDHHETIERLRAELTETRRILDHALDLIREGKGSVDAAFRTPETKNT